MGLTITHYKQSCLTYESSKANLIYEGSSCNLCNQHNGLTKTSRWDITESHQFKKTVMFYHNYEKSKDKTKEKNPRLFLTMKKKI